MRSLLSLAAVLDSKRGSSQSVFWIFPYATLVRFTNVQALISWLHSDEAGEKVDGFFRRMRSHSPLIKIFPEQRIVLVEMGLRYPGILSLQQSKP